MYCLLTAIMLLAYGNSIAQPDRHKLDSLSRAINSSAKRMAAWQDSFVKSQDSIYHSRIGRQDRRTLSENTAADRMQKKSGTRKLLTVAGTFFLLIIIAWLIYRRIRR